MPNGKRPPELHDLEWASRLTDPMRSIRESLQLGHDPLEQIRENLKASIYDPLSAMQERLQSIVRPPDSLARFAEQEQLLQTDRFKDLLQPWKKLDPISQAARDALQSCRSVFEAQQLEWTRLFTDFSRYFERLPDEVRRQIAVLIERGWCLDPEMPHIWARELVEAIEGGDESEAQNWLLDHFRERTDDIEATLKERHPHRSDVLADAFNAHREGRYHLSIPVFLSQADGISVELMERQLYSQKHGVGLRDLIDAMPPDDLLTIFMTAFVGDSPLVRPTRKLPAGFDGLNRHAVFHGIDVAYGTEINSLRAISVLNLASYMLTTGEPQTEPTE